MAWITYQDYSSYSRKPTSPDLGTLSYWVARFEPLIRAEDRGEVIVIIANRSGTEGNTVYAGTSCVLGIEDGEVKVYGILGRGQKELLVVDTKNPPQFKLVAEPNTPIYEDRAQSREALNLNTEQFAQRDSIGPDTPYPSDENRPLGLEAAFGEITAVSPVEPLSSHAFFGSHSPSKRRSSIASSESTATPIAAFSNLSRTTREDASYCECV
jgi:protein N-terminal amidase